MATNYKQIRMATNNIRDNSCNFYNSCAIHVNLLNIRSHSCIYVNIVIATNVL
ncbi:MAG: hypothetical protein KatS3mg095_0438 [Candidatus Parcubacteria bacterium]|nr:MAG: hypothetical protein KatS3mg095_0438 [Candidatus Parcubacteria bacterium]